jgi:hypothetical protein
MALLIMLFHGSTHKNNNSTKIFKNIFNFMSSESNFNPCKITENWVISLLIHSSIADIIQWGTICFIPKNTEI